MIRAWNTIPEKHSHRRHMHTPDRHTHSHTQTLTHSHSDAYSRNYRCAFVRWFAFGLLCTTPDSTPEFIKVCLPTSTRTPTHPHTLPHTHTTVKHSSHKQLSRNHNKFTSAAQMFDKKFVKSFHWFRNISTISMPRQGSGSGSGLRGVLAIDIYGPRCYRVDIS